MNELETLLQAWQPRRPSVKRRRAIFGKPETSPRSIALPFNWLMPAAACLVALLTVLGYSADRFSRAAQSGAQVPMMAMVMSNQSFTACLLGDCRNDQNTLRNTFEWTNAARYTPSIRSLLQ